MLTDTERLMYEKLGATSAERLPVLQDIDDDALRVVLARMHRDALDKFDAADRAVLLGEMVSGCKRRWRVMARATER